MIAAVTEIDPNTMSEGVKALLWVIGLLVTGGGAYVAGKGKKVTLDPNKVEAEKTVLQHFVDDNENEHRNMFQRLTLCEQNIANITGEHNMMKKQMDRIEDKIDRLLQSGAKA